LAAPGPTPAGAAPSLSSLPGCPLVSGLWWTSQPLFLSPTLAVPSRLVRTEVRKWFFCTVLFSVADPDPNPHVFGPPGSGSICQSYGFGSGSRSVYHQAKNKKKKPWLQLLCDFFLLFIFENDVNAPSTSNKQKKLLDK
jgi:hypothetical protein